MPALKQCKCFLLGKQMSAFPVTVKKEKQKMERRRNMRNLFVTCLYTGETGGGKQNINARVWRGIEPGLEEEFQGVEVSPL